MENEKQATLWTLKNAKKYKEMAKGCKMVENW